MLMSIYNSTRKKGLIGSINVSVSNQISSLIKSNFFPILLINNTNDPQNNLHNHHHHQSSSSSSENPSSFSSSSSPSLYSNVPCIDNYNQSCTEVFRTNDNDKNSSSSSELTRQSRTSDLINNQTLSTQSIQSIDNSSDKSSSLSTLRSFRNNNNDSSSTIQTIMISKQYVQQSIRLAHDALSEQDKGSISDSAYTLDCYLASIEYLLSALPNSHYFSKTPSSKNPTINVKLNQLTKQLEELKERLVDEQDEGDEGGEDEENDYDHQKLSDETNELRLEGWNSYESWKSWSMVKKIIPTRFINLKPSESLKIYNGNNSNSSFIKRRLSFSSSVDEEDYEDESPERRSSEPIELVCSCKCGRRVSMRLPDWVKEQPLNSRIALTNPSAGGRNREYYSNPTRTESNAWPEAIISFVITVVVMVKESPLPYWFKLMISSLFSGLIYIESQLELRKMLWKGFVGSIDQVRRLDKEFGLNQWIANLISWLISQSFVLLYAITKFGRTEPSSSFGRRSSISINDEDDDDEEEEEVGKSLRKAHSERRRDKSGRRLSIHSNDNELVSAMAQSSSSILTNASSSTSLPPSSSNRSAHTFESSSSSPSSSHRSLRPSSKKSPRVKPSSFSESHHHHHNSRPQSEKVVYSNSYSSRNDDRSNNYQSSNSELKALRKSKSDNPIRRKKTVSFS